ncbi:MAG: hypothetical protein ACTSPO_08870 [Candidatus Heimdallarchaeaceae archaeon]
MVTINEAQRKLLELINSRNSVKQLDVMNVPKTPSRIIGEKMLNAFASQILDDCEGLECDPTIEYRSRKKASRNLGINGNSYC